MTRAITLALGLLAFAPTLAHAQLAGSDFEPINTYEPSPERFTLELRVGAYRPEHLGSTLTQSFGGDLGPMLALELGVHIVRIPYVGPIGILGGFGWAEWTGPAVALDASGAPIGGNAGNTTLWALPLTLAAFLRVDVLARELSVPLVLVGKLGTDIGYWQASGGSSADGWSVGMRWAVQAALELDWFDERASRRLDDDWGINHSEIFFELYGSSMGNWNGKLPIGTDLAWVVGLGITF